MEKIDNIYYIPNNRDVFIDTKALGSSARVFQAESLISGEVVAIKLLRLKKINDKNVWEQFATEVKLFEQLWDDQKLVKMIDCGFLVNENSTKEIPRDGKIHSCKLDIHEFLSKFDWFYENGGRPYITLELLSEKNNLLQMARGASGSYEKTFRMTTDEGLDLAYQFTQFLINAHSKDIIYMDHKPEHVYWDGENIKIIDLNVSKQLSDSLDAETKKFEKTKDMQNFMMGVLYTVFTGYDFRYNVNALNKRPFADPSHPNAVKKRYENVRSQGILDFAMEETLLPELVELINSVMLNEKYISAEKFLLGLKKCASIIGWNKGEEVVSSEAAQARKLRLSGIKSLYEAQERLNDAKKLFLEANKHNPEDDEARRLYLKCCEFFKHRVLPK